MTEWLTPETRDLLADGLMVTVVLTLITSVASFVVGVAVGTLRLTDNRVLRYSAGGFIEVFRNIPALIQIIFWAFAFPSIFSADVRRAIFFDNFLVDGLGALTGLSVPYYGLAACLGLVLNTSAHLAELFRAGVGTLPREQVDAARSLGAGRRAVFWTILLPDGVRAAFPAMTTRLIHNMKNTALVSFVAVPELFHAVQASITETFRATELLTLAAVMYLALAMAMSGVLRQIDQLLHRGRGRVRSA
jgi:polar amino acid transport system permease protein